MKLAPDVLNRDRQGVVTTYLITWACYGTWLPGMVGSVPRTQNRFGAPLPEANGAKARQSRNAMIQSPYQLDSIRREIILESLLRTCSFCGWTLLAAHVRTNHVHVVITGAAKPERMLNAMKAHCSHALNEPELDGTARRRWARHGSTRYLWTRDAVCSAIQYVVREQGVPMSVYEREGEVW